jgi:hypothetical protein
MRTRLLGLVTALLVLAPAGWSEDKEKQKDVVRLLIYAKKGKKLGARLSALHESGGTLVGVAPKGGVVVEVAADKAAAAEQRLKKSGARVSRDDLPKTQKVNRLILTYPKATKVTADDLKKKGFKLIERYEAGDSALFLVEPTGALDAARVGPLLKDADLRHAELDAPVSIPSPKKESRPN